MEQSNEYVNKRLSKSISSDSKLSECVFESCRSNNSGGSVPISDHFHLFVCGCLFRICESGYQGSSLLIETRSSDIRHTSFIHCNCVNVV